MIHFSGKALVITAALVFVVRLSVYGQNTEFIEILKKEHYSRIKHAVFDISGTVTDVNGKKLDGVSVSITLDRPKNIWATDSEVKSEDLIANGNFHIKKSNYTTMRLSFFKPGYHEEFFIFYTGVKNGEKSPVQNNFHVKLRKEGTLAKLIRFDERVEYNVKSNTQTVFNLTDLVAFPRTKVCPFDKPIRLMKFMINEPTPLKKYMKKYIYLDFERDKQGNIIYEENNGRGIHAPAPKTYLLKFVSSDPSDGFIPIDENTQIKDLSFLTDAPQKEYTAKELVIPYKNDRRYYFYIRCGNYYGKGVVANIGARNGAFNHDYSLLVEILINQKNGDLNLRSR